MKTKNEKANKLAGAGVITAIVASLCCITPVLALIAGTSGIAASFSWLEPFRIYLITITALVLGFAWYLKLRPGKTKEIQCACEEDEKPSFWQSKMFLGIVTAGAVVMLAFPYYSDIFYPDGKKEVVIVKQNDIQTVRLNIKGMTCTSCNRHVEHAAMEVNGVLAATADYETGNAEVQFDNSKTSKDDIIKSIDATGYEVTGERADE